MKRPHLLAVDEAAWAEARRCLPVVTMLANKADRTRGDVEAAARELGYGPTHLYGLLRRYLDSPRLTSLLKRMRGPAPGGTLLDPAVDAVIEEVIDSFYLTRQQPLVADLVRAVHERCDQAGLAARAGTRSLAGSGRDLPPRCWLDGVAARLRATAMVQ